MRASGLILIALLSACTSSLEVGDEAFAQARYAAAAEAYGQADAHEAAAAQLRLALLQAAPHSPLFDPARARETLQALRADHPQSPYGVVAGHLLDGQQRQAALEARLRVLEAQLSAAAEARARLDAEGQAAIGALRQVIEALEEERARLQALVRQLRDEKPDLNLLEEQKGRLKRLELENSRLEREIEALKGIDLRR